MPSAKDSDKNALPPSSGYLISCDVPTKQFIQHLNDTKPVNKKFIIKDLDSTHLLVKHSARDEISRKVDEWMDEVSRLKVCGDRDFVLQLTNPCAPL